ncbi:hypothetical protein ACVOZ6_003527 [Escherichia coli]
MFGVPRTTEDDTKYRIEIPREAFRLRVNSYAIEQTVKELTNYEITLEEPWRDVFRLDQSALSGTNKFYNYNDVGYFIVQPVTYVGADWDVVMPIIERNLAAGVVALKPRNSGRYWVNDPLDGTIWWQEWTMWATFVQTDTMPRMDKNLVLSGGYDFQYNYSVAITSDWVLDNIGKPLTGNIWYVPARNLSYFADAGVQPIYTYHTGTYAGAYLELYPTTPRDWMSGGWERDSTWGMPYNWRAFFRASQNESQFFADASGIGGGISVDAIQGETWEGPDEWNDDRWNSGIVAQAAPQFKFQPPAQVLYQQGGKLEILGSTVDNATFTQWQHQNAKGEWIGVPGMGMDFSKDNATAADAGRYRLAASNETSGVVYSGEVEVVDVYLSIENDINTETDPVKVDNQHYTWTIGRGRRYLSAFYFRASDDTRFTPVGLHARAVVTWSPDNTKVAPITGTDVIQPSGQWRPPLAAGTTTVTATIGNLKSTLDLTVT